MPRSWALAASLLLVVAAGAALWALRSESSLAAAVVEHMADEPASWNQSVALGQTNIDKVLNAAGLHIDAVQTPIVYANSCRLRGHVVPHLVVSTDQGPMTVLLMRDEKISRPEDFSESGYRGVLWPAPDGRGGIALLSRAAGSSELRARAKSLNAHINWSAATP